MLLNEIPPFLGWYYAVYTKEGNKEFTRTLPDLVLFRYR